jgi:hypothetical protein
MVGVVDVFQHTPRSVTDAPPSLVTFPDIIAPSAVSDEYPTVVMLGVVEEVVNSRTVPYEVPWLFTA